MGSIGPLFEGNESRLQLACSFFPRHKSIRLLTLTASSGPSRLGATIVAFGKRRCIRFNDQIRSGLTSSLGLYSDHVVTLRRSNGVDYFAGDLAFRRSPLLPMFTSGTLRPLVSRKHSSHGSPDVSFFFQTDSSARPQKKKPLPLKDASCRCRRNVGAKAHESDLHQRITTPASIPPQVHKARVHLPQLPGLPRTAPHYRTHGRATPGSHTRGNSTRRD